jgi:hypothetical protein
VPRRVLSCVTAHNKVFNLLAEDDDKAIIRNCATGSSMSFPWQTGRGGVLFWDGFLELET